MIFNKLNPCIVESFVSIFYSFKAGIANAISSFKLMKNNIFMKNRHLGNQII